MDIGFCVREYNIFGMKRHEKYKKYSNDVYTLYFGIFRNKHIKCVNK